MKSVPASGTARMSRAIEGKGGPMRQRHGRIVVGLAMVMAAVGGFPGRAAVGGTIDEKDALVVRLVHPDRQAAEVLRLFEGARWRDPAAALAAWKQSAP